MSNPSSRVPQLLAAAAFVFAANAGAIQVNVKVTAENLAATNSITFAPLHFGFNNGSFDAFDIGQVATDPIISVAESGAGTAWQTAFAAADPTATRGTLGGPLTPGNSVSATYTVDSVLNPYFTFATMVVPSNDFFIGNDSPTRFRILDDAGNLLLPNITQQASQIWDAGSEIFDIGSAVFIQGSDGALRAPQNSVVAFNFAELAAFNGLSTAAGYTFTSGLVGDSDVYRISFEVSAVPEVQSYALMAAGLLAVGVVLRRRRQAG